jgi:uncharacterized protein (UPF0332 family)
MKDLDLSELIAKAKMSMDAAKSLLRDGFSDFSISRAYYAMFYAAEALLLSKNLSFSKHSAVISAFGKEFVKTGKISVDLQNYLLDAFDLRHKGDYGPIGSISEAKARELLKQAEEFIESCKGYLKEQGYEI